MLTHSTGQHLHSVGHDPVVAVCCCRSERDYRRSPRPEDLAPKTNRAQVLKPMPPYFHYTPVLGLVYLFDASILGLGPKLFIQGVG